MSQTFAVENYKGIREITLSPTGSLVIIAGGNGAGKSSFIDAFVELFDPKGTRLTPKPIRHGETEARAEFTDTDLGVRIVRTWKKDDAGKLEVFALDGAKYSKPTEVVASLTGGLIFDPVAFLNLDEKRQRDALLAKVDLSIDLEAVAREKAGAETRRLDAGREVKRLQGALSTLTAPGPETPPTEVSAQEVLTDLAEAQEHNARIDRAEDLATELKKELESIARRQQQIRDEMNELVERALQIDRRVEAAVHSAAEPRIDVEPIHARLAAVDETNAAVRAAKEYASTEAALSAAAEAHAAAQADVDRIESEKRAALAGATFPVDGLSVDEVGVTFDGIPFGQVNSAMRRRVAFAIATAGDPKLRLVIVKDGDLLDADSLSGIREVAEERGYTVLVERDRDESREIGFTIENGKVHS